MIIINKNLNRLVAGYDRACQMDRTLLSKWRHSLLVAYASKRQAYEKSLVALSIYQAQVKRNLLVFATIAASLILCCVLGFVFQLFLGNRFPGSNIFPIALLLGCFGFAIAILLAIYGLTQWSQEPPKPPEHPLKSNLLTALPYWRDGLRGNVPTDLPTPGAAAENNFVAFLQFLDDTCFVTYRLRLHDKGEADIVMIGSKGIWLFEVKDWEGEICYRKGVWTRSDRIFYLSGRIEKREPRPVKKPFPDEQWQYVRDDLKETLRAKAADLFFTLPKFTNIHGGIVFTHPNSTRDIIDCPVNWGNPTFWKEKLNSAPSLPGVDERILLTVIDALLERYREITRPPGSRSMLAHAQKTEKEIESRVKVWIGS